MLGLSEATTDTVHRAAKMHPIATLQSEYPIWKRDVDADDLPAGRMELVLCYTSPLGRGFLAGGIRSLTELPINDSRYNDELFVQEHASKPGDR